MFGLFEQPGRFRRQMDLARAAALDRRDAREFRFNAEQRRGRVTARRPYQIGGKTFLVIE